MRYLGASLREHWALILTALVLGPGTAAAVSISASKRYEAGTDILVTPISSADDSFLGTNLVRESGDPSRSVLTVARQVKTPEVADRVRAELDLGLSRQQLLQFIDVRPVSQANVVTIVASQPTPTRAAKLANAFADAFIAQRTAEFQGEMRQTLDRLKRRLAAIPPDQRGPETSALEERLGALSPFVGGSDPTVQISTRAVPPSVAVSPRPVLSVMIAVLASLFLGVGAALAMELFGPRVTREEELLLGQRLPILGRVPRIRRKRLLDYIAGRRSPPRGVWGAYRNLRWSIAGAAGDNGFPRTILVTSATPNEGKTTTVANLAVTLASAGVSVVAVDGDMYRPMLASVFGVAASRASGFADVFLADESAPEVHLVNAPGHGGPLRLLLGAPEKADLAAGIEPQRVKRALERLKREADIIIIDSPVLTEVPDGVVLASAVDAVLVAVWLGRTRRDRLIELRRTLAQHRISPVGFVVTSLKRSRTKGYYPGSPPRRESHERSAEPAGLPSLRLGVERDKA
ncbi:MAG: hypothetical protein M3P41_16005 [Actinomycetota bacterium]|nr:hypothetical protein [Actinomycetota bacterium]